VVPVLLTSLTTSVDELHRSTGWESKPEGLCRGEICVPAPGARRDDAMIDVAVVAERLAMPLVHDDASSLWALGPSTLSGRALETAVVPPLTMTHLDGTPFDFSSLLGRKVILAAWASW
jgi:hypothetical protein